MPTTGLFLALTNKSGRFGLRSVPDFSAPLGGQRRRKLYTVPGNCKFSRLPRARAREAVTGRGVLERTTAAIRGGRERLLTDIIRYLLASCSAIPRSADLEDNATVRNASYLRHSGAVPVGSKRFHHQVPHTILQYVRQPFPR